MWANNSSLFAQISPEVNPTIRLVYNRVDKAGSTSMSDILGAQCRRLGCVMNEVRGGRDFPSKRVYKHILQALPAHGVFVRHAFHLGHLGTGFAWINLVREPVERWASMYDWQRSDYFKKVTGHGPDSTVDPCQMRELSFEACIEAVRASNSSLRIPSQMRYFCEPDENCHSASNCNVSATCTLQQALHVATTHYHLVGITEDFAGSINAFEWLLP